MCQLTDEKAYMLLLRALKTQTDRQIDRQADAEILETKTANLHSIPTHVFPLFNHLYSHLVRGWQIGSLYLYLRLVYLYIVHIVIYIVSI